jgi:hypothetical protein
MAAIARFMNGTDPENFRGLNSDLRSLNELKQVKLWRNTSGFFLVLGGAKALIAGASIFQISCLVVSVAVFVFLQYLINNRLDWNMALSISQVEGEYPNTLIQQRLKGAWEKLAVEERSPDEVSEAFNLVRNAQRSLVSPL